MNIVKKYKIALGMIVYLIGVICYGIFTYYDTKRQILKRIDDRLLNAAFAVPFILGDEYHDKIKDKHTISREEYITMVMRLSKYCNQIGLTYLYTMVKDENHIFFTSSSATPEELEEKDYGKLFDPYPEASKKDFAAFESSEPIFMSETSDRWGDFRSVLVPIGSNSGVIYVAGADMTLDEVKRRVGMSVILALTSAFFFLVLAFPSVYLFYSKVRQRELMTRFLPKEMVEDIEAGRLTLQPGGVERHVTVLLSDIRGFTALSEQISPSELVELLNEYLSCMTDIVFAYRGTLDKFIGDAVMAIFGSPVTYPDDPERALQAARKMLESIDELNTKLAKRNLPKISIGIALNSGVVVAGNIGSPKRLDYTVIGNVVNLATRVEELNKELDTCLLLTEKTYQYVAELIDVNVVTERFVKGCSKPIKVYGVKNLSCQEVTALSSVNIEKERAF